jgi:DNA repair exonuclease SbcCD nuclease subunit
MKLGMIGDAHLGCADFTERRRADFASAFVNAVDTCLGAGAEALCLLGDVFDSALMRRNVEAFATTVKDIGPVLTRLQKIKVPVLAIAGNHEFGRGREAAELGILESLGFLRVLRNEEHILAGVAIVGVPYHSEDELPTLPGRVRDLVQRSRARRRILLLHNFIRGSVSIPSHLGEVDQSVAAGFDRVFVGHHHDAEELGRFVMPGATEVQNLAEADQRKAVVIFDTESGAVVFQKLPKTRDVVVLSHDISDFGSGDELFAALAKGLCKRSVSSAFVCVRIRGIATPRCSVSKAEIVTFLRERDVFDRFVEVRTERPVRNASQAVKGTTVEGLLHREFGVQSTKAKNYIDRCTDDGFPAALVDEVLR